MEKKKKFLFISFLCLMLYALFCILIDFFNFEEREYLKANKEYKKEHKEQKDRKYICLF